MGNNQFCEREDCLNADWKLGVVESGSNGSEVLVQVLATLGQNTPPRTYGRGVSLLH